MLQFDRRKQVEMNDLKEALGGEAPLLPWDRFAAWVHSICVVTFDLELGQAIESSFPAHVQLSEADRQALFLDKQTIHFSIHI